MDTLCRVVVAEKAGGAVVRNHSFDGAGRRLTSTITLPRPATGVAGAPPVVTMGFEHDSAGNRTKAIWSGGEVRWEHDGLNRVTAVRLGGDPTGLACFCGTSQDDRLVASGRALGHAIGQSETAMAVMGFVPLVSDVQGLAEFEREPTLLGGIALVAGIVPGIGEVLGPSVKGLKALEKTGLGDLTVGEIKAIQGVVNEAGRPLDVVGSAARGTRRGVGTDLPIGKGPGTKSDIDYVSPPGSHPYFNGIEERLPSLDPETGLIPGSPNPHIGPSIRFEPDTPPYFVPEQ